MPGVNREDTHTRDKKVEVLPRASSDAGCYRGRKADEGQKSGWG
jgi:hypothetical protein